jgi:hypothetical protein
MAHFSSSCVAFLVDILQISPAKYALSERLLGFFLTSDFASFLPALRCFFRQDRLGIDSKSASIGQKILQNQSATKIPNSL